MKRFYCIIIRTYYSIWDSIPEQMEKVNALQGFTFSILKAYQMGW